MGTSLTGLTPATTYDALIKVGDNGPLSATAKYLSDGLGNDSILALSTTLVGIGTSTPSTQLEVQNGPAGTAIKVSNTGGGNAQLAISSNATSVAELSFTNSLSLTGGNVGIGTSSPGSTLDVNGVVRVASYLEGAAFPYSLVAGSGADATITTLRGGSTAGQACSVVVSGGSAATNANSIVFNVASAERGRWTTNGLTFNGDTAAANALDDYEEGTWTMGVSFNNASTGITYSTNTGTYTKIGRQVTVNGYVVLTDKGSATGTARITGLPFTIGSASGNYGGASMYFENISFANQFQGWGIAGTTSIALYEIVEAGNVTVIDNANFSNTSAIILSLTYFV